MEIGLFTYPYQYLAIEEAFSDAASSGYDFIELWGGQPFGYAPDLLEGGCAGLLKLCEKFNMPIKVYTPEHNAYPYNYMLGTELQRARSVDYLKKCLLVAKELGAGHMLISIGHGGNAPEEERFARLKKSLAEIVCEAERLKQSVVLETLTAYESNTCTTLPELKCLLDDFDSEYLNVILDTVVPLTQNEEPVDYFRVFGERLKHVHLVDSDGTEAHLVPGDGIYDLKPVVEGLASSGYDGTYTIELISHYMHDPHYYSKLAILKARDLFAMHDCR